MAPPIARCVPTRNSFLSGRRPDVTRVFNDGIGNKSFRDVGAHWTALPQHFKESGWFTTGVGKTYHPNLPPNFDQPWSWSNTTGDFPYFYPRPINCPPDGPSVWCAIPASGWSAPRCSVGTFLQPPNASLVGRLNVTVKPGFGARWAGQAMAPPCDRPPADTRPWFVLTTFFVQAGANETTEDSLVLAEATRRLRIVAKLERPL